MTRPNLSQSIGKLEGEPDVIETAAYTGELGGMLAMAFASGAVATFGYSWAFFVVPARKLVADTKTEVETLRIEIKNERDRCDAAMEKMAALYRSDMGALSSRIKELELLLNVRSVLGQKDQIISSMINRNDRLEADNRDCHDREDNNISRGG